MAKITNSLLKQAIADAEAVRETAVANAKLVLEEAITPQIREMIARRLRVEAMEGEEEIEETAKEVPHEEGEAEGGKDFPADSSEVGKGDNKEPSDASFDTSGVGDGGENKEDSHTDWYDDWSDSDFDLDEVIKELEEDINRLSEAKGKKEEEEEEMVSEGEEHEEEEEEEEEHEGEKEVKEGWKTKKEGTGVDAKTFAHAAAPTGEEGAPEEDEIDLDEILAELEAEESEGEEEEEMPAPMAAKAPVAPEKDVVAEKIARIKHLQQELAQYREAVEILRGQLHEVKLLNAKLLYTNKLFRKDLTNEQKVRVVESFDRATTVREVKLVYTALMENIGSSARSFNATRKKVVAEGFASKATPTTAPKKEVIVENAVAKRLQELAGIL